MLLQFVEKKEKAGFCDGRTNQPTDRRTDTKKGVRDSGSKGPGVKGVRDSGSKGPGVIFAVLDGPTTDSYQP